MAEKQTSKDRMREIVDSIENGIKELFESDKYQQYLSTMSRFHRYSVNDCSAGLLLFLPFFGIRSNQTAQAVSLLSLAPAVCSCSTACIARWAGRE